LIDISGASETASRAKEREYWLSHGNLANLLNVDLQDHTELHVPLNLVFVGFSGEGNQGFDLKDEDLGEWFEEIAEAFPHSIVPSVTDLASSHEVVRTKVRYRYDYKIIRADPKVNEVVETIIHRSLRKEEHVLLYPEAPVQVDNSVESWRLSDALTSLTGFLGLNETSYTIFILNPKRANYKAGLPFYEQEKARKRLIELEAQATATAAAAASDPSVETEKAANLANEAVEEDLSKPATYGYRQGFSTPDMNNIQEDPAMAQLKDSVFEVNRTRVRVRVKTEGSVFEVNRGNSQPQFAAN